MICERLDVWKRSKDLAVNVYKQMANCRDQGFKDQITRCSLSVVSNIADKIASLQDVTQQNNAGAIVEEKILNIGIS